MNSKLWTLAVIGCVSLSVLSQAEVVTLVADEWCPYNCEETSTDPGFAVEAALTILGNAGIEARYVVLEDWDESIERTRAGEFSAIIGAAVGDAPDFVFPGESLAESVSCFFVRAGDAWRYTGPESLQGRRIAAIEAYDYNSDVISENTYNNVVRFDSLEACVEALLAGQVDTFVEDSFVVQLFELQNYLTGELQRAGCLEGDDVFIAFSPANPRSAEYARILSEGIAAMRASGEWTALLAKYGIR